MVKLVITYESLIGTFLVRLIDRRTIGGRRPRKVDYPLMSTRLDQNAAGRAKLESICYVLRMLRPRTRIPWRKMSDDGAVVEISQAGGVIVLEHPRRG